MFHREQVILVTGANGQLGNEFRLLAKTSLEYSFLFVSKEELDICNIEEVRIFFSRHSFSHCINCAAYTAVDRAESEKEMAFRVNAGAVGNLASICNKNNVRLIHISTDYVFDGESNTPIKEDHPVGPLGVYGASKLEGEELCRDNDPSSIILRTSWVYSSFGNNFVKTMLRLMKEKESLQVVNDQFGRPTYAADLANAILAIIRTVPLRQDLPSLFHFSNIGKEISWYDFALAIKEISGSPCRVDPIPSSSYPRPARRPHYAVLDTTAFQQHVDYTIPDWKESLSKCLALLTH